MFIIYSTFPNKEEALKIRKKLLEEKLVGCFNMVPITSGYWWEGRVVIAEEFGVIFKVSEEKVDKTFKRLRNLHPYKIPVILCLKVNRVNEEYERWIRRVTE